MNHFPPAAITTKASYPAVLFWHLAYLVSHACLGILRDKLKGAALVLASSVWFGTTGAWTFANWAQLGLTVLCIYGVTMLVFRQFVTSAEQVLRANGYCAQDGQCPRPYP